MADAKEDVKELLKKYQDKIAKELGEEIETDRPVSAEYKEFKKQYMPRQLTYYEKLCAWSEKYINIKPDKKKVPEYEEAIEVSHLEVTPAGVYSFTFLAPLIIVVFGAGLSFILLNSMFMVLFFLIAGAGLFFPLAKMPMYLANSWRMKASNQMVLSIFYIVSYMRHTSNLELAVEFASKHLAPPLSLDLRRVLWNVETAKYESVKESLDAYLDSWKKWNMEYIEAMHLIEGSLYEGSEDRRLNMLDKSLNVILDGTYEKMLHYAQNLKSPITMLHMLGIILPILGLVILPLMINFMQDAQGVNMVKWYHIAMIYNIGLPIVVYYMGKNILSTRPTGYGDTDVAEENPELKKYRNIIINLGNFEIKINPLWLSIGVAVLCFIIGFSPILLHAVGFPDLGFGERDELSACGAKFCLLGYKEANRAVDELGRPLIIGPFGLGASVLSLAVIIGLGVSAGLYFRLRSKNVIKIRNDAKKLETEFASALFQLGNRLGDGIPAEMAFGRVATVMEGTVSGNFFQLVSQNVRRLGMSVEKAIFDKKHGALVAYPSSMIASSMKVLTESAKKGPRVAAEALINISQYIKQMHKVDERLKDLLADTISSMKSQIRFLTPVIAGVVIGITSMITMILGKLSVQMKHLTSQSSGAAGVPTNLVDMFGDGIPTFYFQIIVGIYVVQIIYILTILTNGIENGEDKLAERFSLGDCLTKSTLTYVFITLAVTVIFSSIAATVLSRM